MRCREELPLVERIQKKFRDDGLVVIALGFKDSRDNIARCIDDLKLSEITFAYDAEDRVAGKYDIGFVAGSIFIDRNGVVTKSFPGGFNEPQLLKETYRILK